MRKISLLFLALIALALSSFKAANIDVTFDSKFTYYKSFNITHESTDLGHTHIERKLILNKNMEYNLLLEENDCDVVIQIHDENGKLMMTNFDTRHNICFNSIIFPCKATKSYTISLDPKRSKAHGVCKVGFRRVATN